MSRVVEATSRTGDVVRDSGKGGDAPADFITARTFVCATCGALCETRKSTQLYCSISCKTVAWRERNPNVDRKYYQRVVKPKRTGIIKPEPVRLVAEADRRFWGKVDISGGPAGCWMWTAFVAKSGYGQVKRGGKMFKAHRLAYEMCVGPVPDGLELDHLCRERGCVNPLHLEPVTHQHNAVRGLGAAGRDHVGYCRNGHPYDAANTYVSAKSGVRACRACKRAYLADYRKRRA